MPKCFTCSKKEGHDVFYPPDMVNDPIEEGEHKGERICHFCARNTDRLIGTDGTIFDKQAVIKDYQEFCESIWKNPNIYKSYHDKMVETSIKRSMDKKNG